MKSPFLTRPLALAATLSPSTFRGISSKLAGIAKVFPVALFFTLNLLCLGADDHSAADSGASATNAISPEEPPIIDDGSGWIVINQPIALHAPGLGKWYEKKPEKPLQVYINGIELPGADIWLHKLRDDWITILLRRDPSDQHNRDAWNRILCSPKGLLGGTTKVTATIGRDNETPLSSSVTLPLRVISGKWFCFWVILMLILLVALLVLGKRTELLRDDGPQPTTGRRPYSLARAQMAFWLFLTVGAFLFIFLVTGDTNTLTPEVLTLIGISAGTGFGAVLMDTAKRDRLTQQLAEAEQKKAQLTDPALQADPQTAVKMQQQDGEIQRLRKALEPSASSGFWPDMVSDGDGVSFHRLQIVVWTLVVGLIFTSSVYSALTMPQLSATLLGLMGISGGTYLGFKLPES